MPLLTEARNNHNRINIYLLEAIVEAYLKDLPALKGKNVGEQSVHINNVRLMWIKVADLSLLDKWVIIEKDNISKVALIGALNLSAKVVEPQLENPDAKAKRFKPQAARFLGCLFPHISHHSGQIMLALKQSEHPVDQKTQYGLWEWGTR